MIKLISKLPEGLEWKCCKGSTLLFGQLFLCLISTYFCDYVEKDHQSAEQGSEVVASVAGEIKN